MRGQLRPAHKNQFRVCGAREELCNEETDSSQAAKDQVDALLLDSPPGLAAGTQMQAFERADPAVPATVADDDFLSITKQFVKNLICDPGNIPVCSRRNNIDRAARDRWMLQGDYLIQSKKPGFL